jgi:protein TonB
MRVSLLLLALSVSVVQSQTASSFAPRLIHKTDPAYTKQALDAKLEGSVTLSAMIGTDGVPSDIKVVRGLGNGLDEKSVECFQAWRFSPGLKNGQPIPVKAQVVVTFRMPLLK